MAKYDNDFKYRAIESFCNGKNTIEINEIYGVSPSTFFKWVRKFISDGPFEKENELSDKRKDFSDRGIDNLFTSQRGALTRTAVNKSFDKYSKLVGYNLKERLHPHAIRHLFTQNLMKRKSVSYSAIKQLLGHSLTTTDIYGQLSKSDLLEILDDMGSLLKE